MYPLSQKGLRDALDQLTGWTGDNREICRSYYLDDAQHDALTERVKVCSDVLRLRPEIRRLDGTTRIRVASASGNDLTAGEVALAARIEDAYRTVVEMTRR